MMRSPLTVRRTAAAACLIAMACTTNADASRAVAFSATDSAGVRLIRNGGVPEQLDSMRLELIEELRIGVVDGEEPYQFDEINGVTVTEDGRLFVANGGTNTVRVFDASGRFLREFGGTGKGPAEFDFLATTVVFGDTVAAIGPDKVAVFDTLGNFRTSWATRRAMPASASRGELAGSAHVWITGRDSAGWLGYVIRYDWSREYEVGRAYQDTVEVRRYDILTGEAGSDVVDRWPLGPVRHAIATRGEGALLEPIWQVQVIGARRSDGFRYSADGLRYSIDVHDAEGRLVRRITRAHAPVPITDADVQAYVDSMRAIIDDPDRRFFPGERERLRRKYLEQQPALGRPPSLQALGIMIVLDDGSLWVSRPDLHTTAREIAWAAIPFGRFGEPIFGRQWDHFDPDGQYVGAIVVPERFEFRRFTSDGIVGIARDSLDVEYVVRFRVGR